MEKLDFTEFYVDVWLQTIIFFLKGEFLQKILDLLQELLEVLKLSRDFLETVMKNDKTYEKLPHKKQTSLTWIKFLKLCQNFSWVKVKTHRSLD